MPAADYRVMTDATGQSIQHQSKIGVREAWHIYKQVRSEGSIQAVGLSEVGHADADRQAKPRVWRIQILHNDV